LDFYLRALPDLDAFTKEGYLRALDLLEQAIGRDPDYGPALALTAECHSGLEVNGWTADPEAARRKSIDFARRAVRSAPDDPTSSRSRPRGSDISARTSMCRSG
jgi:adenylate cyclase